MKKSILIPVVSLICVICLSAVFLLASGKSRQDKIEDIIPSDNVTGDEINTVENPKEEKNILFTGTSVNDISIDITDPAVTIPLTEHIVVAKIKRIEGAINYNPVAKCYTKIATIGELEIMQVLKGDLKPNDQIPFLRCGGVIDFYNYEKGMYEAEKAKNPYCKSLSEEEKKEYYVKEVDYGDFELEEEKTYLLYLNYSSDYERYGISFSQYGAFEYNSQNNMVKRHNDGDFIRPLEDVKAEINEITAKAEKAEQ